MCLAAVILEDGVQGAGRGVGGTRRALVPCGCKALEWIPRSTVVQLHGKILEHSCTAPGEGAGTILGCGFFNII